MAKFLFRSFKLNTMNNRISFKAEYAGKTTVQKIGKNNSYHDVKTAVVKLDIKSKYDYEMLKKLNKHWETVNSLNLINGVLSDFTSPLEKHACDYAMLMNPNEIMEDDYVKPLTEGIFYDFSKLLNIKDVHDYYVVTAQKYNFGKLDYKDVLGIIEYTHDKDKKYDYIDHIQVNPKYMNKSNTRLYKNVGTALLDFIKNLKGFDNIYLDSLKSAVNFYTKNGFEVVDDTIKQPLMRFCRKNIK